MRVLVADDDARTADLLAGYCRKVEPGARVEIAPAGDAARERLSDSAWDLLLLDLDLPGISGRELVALVPDDLPVIIVTGDPGFAADAFGHDVADYLVKPVAFDRFAQAWRKAVGKVAPAPRTTGNTVFVRTGTDIVRLELEQVRYIRSESNYVRFLLSEEAPGDRRELTSLMSLKDLERKLPDGFVRVHRSYIVNLRHIDKLDSADIKIGRDLIPVSETYRDELIRRLELL